MTQITTPVAADTPYELNVSPFLEQNPTEFYSVPGATVYGVYLAGKDARSGYYQWWEGDGVTTTWDEDAIVNLANTNDDGGALTTAANLLTVIKVNDVVLKRVSSAGAPGAGEFTCADNGGKQEVIFGTAPALGAKIEVFIRTAVDKTYTLVATEPQEQPAPQVVIGSAAFQAIRLTR